MLNFTILAASCGGSATFQLSTENAKFKGNAERLKAAIDKIAQENELNPDENCRCNLSVYLCYMGDPYHYFTISINQERNQVLNLEIIHDVRIGAVDYHKPFEEKLLKMLRTDYKVKETVKFVSIPYDKMPDLLLQCEHDSPKPE